MKEYETYRELEKLYEELDTARKADEQTVCLMYNADSKEEILRLINDEIAFYERRLTEMEAGSREYGEEDGWTGVDPGFADEADYMRYRYGY